MQPLRELVVSMPLTDHLESLADQLRVSQRILLFSDFDGTLVPIMDHPADCYLDATTRATLTALSQLARVSVAIISGRELMELCSRVGIASIAYAGNHGVEIAGPGFTYCEPQAEQLIPEIDSLTFLLETELAQIPDIWIENKVLSASVHYRMMDPTSVPAFIEKVGRMLTPYLQSQQIVLRHGKKVLEVRPNVDWNKATAVHWLAQRMSKSIENPLLIFLGDDETDNDVFQAWPYSITVSVGNATTTSARYFVPDHLAVHAFLQWLWDTMSILK